MEKKRTDRLNSLLKEVRELTKQDGSYQAIKAAIQENRDKVDK